MADFKMLSAEMSKLKKQAETLINLSGYRECRELTEADGFSSIKDADERQQLEEYEDILCKLDEILDTFEYYEHAVTEEGFLHRNHNGKYETDSGYRYISGSSIEFLRTDPETGMETWTNSWIKRNGKDYYIVGYREVELKGLKVRIRENNAMGKNKNMKNTVPAMEGYIEYYSPLDCYKRSGPAYAVICQKTLNTGEQDREKITSKPSGWVSQKYDLIGGRYLYNRCHLIGCQLTANIPKTDAGTPNCNRKKLITGTRFLNESMLEFENDVVNYLENNPNTHVFYRVTPVYTGNNALADRVLMETYSIEDEMPILYKCIENVQPGIKIDYRTGESTLADSEGETPDKKRDSEKQSRNITFVLNTGTKKFHTPDCPSTGQMSANNKKEVDWIQEKCRDEGYEPCQYCIP